MTTTLTHSWYLTLRHLRALARQPWYVAITLVQPIVWLLLFGALFGRAVEIPGFGAASYVAFLTPGVVAMTALFTNGWSGMAIIDDLDRGVMDRFLVSPARRGALMAGLVAHQAVVTAIQSTIIVALALLAGARFAGGAAGLAVLLVGAVLLGAAFAALSNALALLLRRRESVIAANQFIVLPLTFLSTTFLPADLMPPWMQGLARANPLNWAVEAGRAGLTADADGAFILARLAGLLAFAVVCAWLATRAFRAYQRSV